MEELKWTRWEPMPCPENCRMIEGPDGPGVYQIKNKRTKEFILFGESITCRKRMKSFFPKPYGSGTRNNQDKRNYILTYWNDLVYRTLSVNSKEEAVYIDRYLQSLKIHKFNT